MKRFCVIATASLLVACASPPAADHTSTLIQNANFVKIDAEKPNLPAQWRADGQFVEIALDRMRMRTSTPSLRVQFKEGAPYAGVVQRMDLDKVRGKSITVRAYIDRAGEGAEAGVWVRAFDKNRESMAYENTYETKHLPAGQWTLHQLRINVPAEADAVLVGVSIYGKDGTMWVDAIEAQVI